MRPALWLVDQSSLDRKNRCRNISCQILDITIPSEDIRNRSLKLFKIAPNYPTIQLLALHFVGGGAESHPQFWYLDYKIEHISDHVAKFHVDRPRELRDLTLKKRKKHQ